MQMLPLRQAEQQETEMVEAKQEVGLSDGPLGAGGGGSGGTGMHARDQKAPAGLETKPTDPGALRWVACAKESHCLDPFWPKGHLAKCCFQPWSAMHTMERNKQARKSTFPFSPTTVYPGYRLPANTDVSWRLTATNRPLPFF